MSLIAWMPLSVITKEESSRDRIRDLIADFPFEDALFFACLVNAMLCNEDIQNHRQRQFDAATLLTLGTTKTPVFNYIKYNETPFALSRVHMLELIKWLCAFATGAGENINSDNFITAAVMAAEMSARRHDPSLEKKKGETNLEHMRRAVPGMREKAVLGLNGWFPLHSLGRAKSILIDRMFQNDKFATAFKSNTGITLDEFVTCMAGVATLGLGAFDPDSGKRRYIFQENNLWAKAGEFRETYDKFFAHFSQTPTEFRASLEGTNPAEFHDFKFLRNKPILRMTNGQCVIPDPQIFAQCLAAGPIFQTLSVGANHVFGGFGDAFEDYSREIFSTFHQRLTEHGIDNGQMTFNRRISDGGKESREMADVSITQGDSLVLIETKGVWLKDEVLYTLDPVEFWKEVNTKYGAAQSKKERNKGFAQLADTVAALADGSDLVLENGEEPQVAKIVLPDTVKTIYPVLLVHDAVLNSSGWLPHLLGVDFAQRLGLSDAPNTGTFEVKGKARTFTVANLIVCTIQEIEQLVAIRDEKTLLAHIKKYSAADALRLIYTFSDYVNGLGTANSDWSPLVKPSQEMMIRAGRILLGKHKPARLEIEKRAYKLWQNRGSTDGDDLRDWFDAERELVVFGGG